MVADQKTQGEKLFLARGNALSSLLPCLFVTRNFVANCAQSSLQSATPIFPSTEYLSCDGVRQSQHQAGAIYHYQWSHK